MNFLDKVGTAKMYIPVHPCSQRDLLSQNSLEDVELSEEVASRKIASVATA